MKLRIRGNSIRLRLTRSDVDALVARGTVEEAASFGGSDRLGYVLRASDVPAVRASFRGGVVCVEVPGAEARSWASSDRVGISAEQAIEGGESLRVLIEKDFACLKSRSGEDESDAFPNPHETC